MIDLVLSQLSDLFRIGLLIALVITMLRTSAVTGRALPLIMGVLFVAVILPTTMPSGTASVSDAILAGLVSNSLITGLIIGVAAVFTRLRR